MHSQKYHIFCTAFFPLREKGYIKKVAGICYYFKQNEVNCGLRCCLRTNKDAMSDLSQNYIIQLRDIEYKYPQGQALRFSDLLIPKGQHTLILGDSGSGKTTLLHILSGLLKPRNGQVFIQDQALYQLGARELDQFRGQHIGLIFQDPHLIKSLTVSENLQVAQKFAGVPIDRERIAEVLDLLNIGDKADAYPLKLSRGQAQRVAIARAVVNSPAILVADEPTASLDDTNTENVLRLLRSQAEKNNATLIIATHDKRVKSVIPHEYIVQNIHQTLV